MWGVLILIATSVRLSDPALRSSVPWLDKAVHGALYGVFGWLVGIALAGTRWTASRVVIVGLAGLAGFAAVDEAHQLWLPGRVTSIADWMADVAGALTGLTGAVWLGRSADTDGSDANRKTAGGSSV